MYCVDITLLSLNKKCLALKLCILLFQTPEHLLIDAIFFWSLLASSTQLVGRLVHIFASIGYCVNAKTNFAVGCRYKKRFTRTAIIRSLKSWSYQPEVHLNFQALTFRIVSAKNGSQPVREATHGRLVPG